MRRERELEEQRVADELVEVELVALERIGLALDRRGLEELVDVHREVLADVDQAHAALGAPVSGDGAADHDALGHPLERHLHVHRRLDHG